jgi:histidinol-phosphate/aromatic aminotransferase/cobyric acid decarboxylase-like protein
VELIMTETGFTIKKSTNTLKKILDDLIDQIKLITVTTPNGPSGTPINAAAFDPIKTSVDQLMEE